MKSAIIVAIIILLGVGAFAFSRSNKLEPVEHVEKIVTEQDKAEQQFQDSQPTSSDNSLTSIESDLDSTVIQDEDFSDLE